MGSLRTQSARHRVDHGTISGRSCANSGPYKPLCASVDRTKFVATASAAGPNFFWIAGDAACGRAFWREPRRFRVRRKYAHKIFDKDELSELSPRCVKRRTSFSQAETCRRHGSAVVFLRNAVRPRAVFRRPPPLLSTLPTNPAPAILTGGGVLCSISDFEGIIR
jgi:hypothetical protein